MKKHFLTFVLIMAFCQTQAQVAVNISGQIENLNAAESIYLGIDGRLFPLNPPADGTFSVDVNISQTPSFFYLGHITKGRKFEQKTPSIWFESDSVQITKDWSDQSYQMQGLLPFQDNSEKIEALKGKDQFDFILANPIDIPSLYFVERQKKKIGIPDLERFTQLVKEEHQNAAYVKRIENYIAAKKLDKIKIGSKVGDFTLPDKDGNQVSVIQPNNKTTLIALFSSGCGYSVASIGILEKVADLNNDKIEMITIWEDSSREIWLNTRKDEKEKITWTNLWDEFGFASTYLNNKMWPTFYVINAEGELEEIIRGYSQKTSNKLKELVK
ncbi:redoxin domain-containing protein [Aquiflexum sp. LQ15W]|uniref:TlpA family protein disulfide reductase n=1 Tax=Cognataquiflexum nitidum TaxID=2922272 RepID=UPI001F12A429|nr:TlpA disulfide reductase family protein [Cognataquiflexum nitidum]MCH6199521.1 redoxin domain-containing protein [Cognataquiflexum nitidum]